MGVIRRTIIAAVFGLLVLAACGSGSNLDEPPEIFYGEDICDHCNMIISEPRYAASYLTTDGTTRRFDDTGGLFLYHAEHNEDVHAFWVHDYESEEWIRAESAFYVITSDVYTPMDHGVFAFGDEAGAAEFAEGSQESEILGFGEVLAQAKEGNFEHEHHHEMHESP